MKSRQARLLRDITYGAIGGIVGTVMMEQVTTFLYRFESEEKKKKEESLRTEEPPQVMARKLAGAAGVELSEENRAAFGQILHWGYGMTWGALYGILRQRVPVLSSAAGLPFGILFTLIGDEALNTYAKLTPPPRAFPIEAHLRGLAGHIAWTSTAEGVIQLLEFVADEQ